LKREPWLFGSFFLGGFESSTHVTTRGRRLDQVAATQHDLQADEDYALCRRIGIRAVREAARWPLIDRGGRLDLGSVREMVRAGRRAGLAQIWDLMHYGYPDDLDPFSAEFVDRFAAYARAVADVVCHEAAGPTYYTPINEISYYAWAAAEIGYMAPFLQGCGRELKRALVRAAIAAADAIWEVDPDGTIFTVDPLVRMHPPPGRPDLRAEVDHFNRHVVTEGFDLLAGRLEPELGGSRAHLGIVALNYYRYNQWTLATPELPQRFLDPGHPDWVPLSDLLLELQERYGGPLLIGETSANGEQRPPWLAHLVREASRALERGVDLQGICWYPTLTSPDWEDPTAFLQGGIVDVAPRPDGRLRRVLPRPNLVALREAQAELDPDNVPIDPLDPEPPAGPEPPLRLVCPIEHARVQAENFSYETLLAGDSLAVELYTFGPGAWIATHRHEATEHVLMPVAGEARVHLGTHSVTLRPGETFLVPAGQDHSIHNDGTEPLVVQQISAPKPWDARFGGPHPGQIG
jgi:mannose-6-phosphate isomerase-like protein (cupin superfamily)